VRKGNALLAQGRGKAVASETETRMIPGGKFGSSGPLLEGEFRKWGGKKRTCSGENSSDNGVRVRCPARSIGWTSLKREVFF